MKWLADENFRNAIIRGIRRQSPAFDILRAQDVQTIAGRDDVAVLKYATNVGRVLLTQDCSTMLPAMRSQLRLSSRCTPIVFVPDSMPVGHAIEDILLIDECATGTDWESGVLYLPLR